jgi:hypothetical protein
VRAGAGRYDPAPMRISLKLAALGAFFVLSAAVVAGCGSSSDSVGSKSVVSMAGNQISTKAYKHWTYVAAKGEAEQEAEEGETGAPVIAPTDPPKFTGCIKQVRQQLPSLAKTSDTKIRSECKQLFGQLNQEVIGFLVESYWYQADAHKLGITVTNKQANAAYLKEKKAEFPTAAEYTAYLTEGGLTDADVRYEIRVNTVYAKLLKRYMKKVTTADISAYYKQHKSTLKESLTKATKTIKSTLTQANETAAENQVTALSKKNWAKKTQCAADFAVATYCGNYKAPKNAATTTSTSATPSATPTSTSATSSATPTTTTSSK